MAPTRGSLESWLEEVQIKVHPALDIIDADEGLSIRANASVEPKTSSESLCCYLTLRG